MLKKLVNSEDNKRLFYNFLSLSFLQCANYLLPLITFPYLIRVIGIDKFGLIAFAGAIVSYFVIITDYGFNLTATRLISINRCNINKINRIFSNVMIIKFSLTVLSFVILCFLIIIFPKLRDNYLIYLFSFGAVIGQVLFPVWFFQGMEQMKFITYLNVLSKLVFTITIFIFVNTSADYYIVPILTSSGAILSGLLSIVILKNKFHISFTSQPIKIIKYFLYDGYHIFITSIFSSFYRRSNVIILGFFASDTCVGYYSIAEKLIKLIQSLQDVVGRTLFPYFTRKFNKNKTLFFTENNRYIKYVVIYYVLLTGLIFIASPVITKILTGQYNDEIIINLKIMSFIILFGGMSYYLGVLGLITLNYKKEYSRYIINTGIFSIISSSLCAYFFTDIGISYAFMLSELFLFLQIVFKINKVKREINL